MLYDDLFPKHPRRCPRIESCNEMRNEHLVSTFNIRAFTRIDLFVDVVPVQFEGDLVEACHRNLQLLYVEFLGVEVVFFTFLFQNIHEHHVLMILLPQVLIAWSHSRKSSKIIVDLVGQRPM